jgi:hypothetical protein
MNKDEWFAKNGFNAEGCTCLVIGEDTYSIKDYLKEQGCKYSPLLKWHISYPIDLPQDFRFCVLNVEAIGKWNEKTEEVDFFENAKEIVDKKVRESLGPSLSQYIGDVGKRLRNVTAVYKSSRGFVSAYGVWTYIHTFEINSDVLVWFTQVPLDLERGQVIDFSGTIVSHEEFRGVKTTRVNRCRIKEVQ